MFTLKMQTDNAAFDANDMAECARILREIALDLEAGNSDGKARDFNGNTVGKWELKP